MIAQDTLRILFRYAKHTVVRPIDKSEDVNINYPNVPILERAHSSAARSTVSDRAANRQKRLKMRTCD